MRVRFGSSPETASFGWRKKLETVELCNVVSDPYAPEFTSGNMKKLRFFVGGVPQ